ncbi:MAG: 4-hydroxybenzoate octaprenyltransferase, partial [Coxiellaceae bacterium]|nr:4-hydroxybenzoate octaprenyltransferase [Coxiellaceae bacterium]
RSAGCAINDVADRGFDGFVDRTKHRPLVTGEISVNEALLLCAVLFACAFFLVLQLNAYAILLSVVGFLLAVIYPFLKRVTDLPQLWLGVAFAWGIPMAFAAADSTIPWIGWWLFATTLLWIVAYDAMYAMADRKDDVIIGVKSIAILMGQKDVVLIVLLQCIVLLQFIALGVILQFNAVFFLAVIVAATLVAYQYRLIKDRQPTGCFHAFLNNHWFGMVMCVGFVSQKLI